MLATVCDPYMMVFQKKLYQKYWKNEVDEILLNINGRNEQIKDFIYNLWKPECKYIEKNRMMRQGTAFNYLYPNLTGDIVMTMDTDNFIYRRGVISDYKVLIENNVYDAIGSIGSHAYPSQLSQFITNKYGLVRLNPFMSFWRKSIFDQFEKVEWSSIAWKAGDQYQPLGVIPIDGYAEVMSDLSLQFFYRSNKILKIPATKYNEYVHVGGLSSIYRKFFLELEHDQSGYHREDGKSADIYYLIWRYQIFELTKNEVPFKEYNDKYSEIFENELKQTRINKQDFDMIIERDKKLFGDLFLC